MRKQDGYTMVEMVLVVAVLGLLSTFAALAGASLVTSSRVSRALSEVRYNATFARVEATGRYQQWRIRLLTNANGIAQQYVLESCDLAPGSPVTVPCPNTWVGQGSPVQLSGVGLRAIDSTGQSVDQLVFDRTGLFYLPDTAIRYRQDTVQVTVCTLTTDAGGNTVCGATSKVIQLQKFSGAVQYL